MTRCVLCHRDRERNECGCTACPTCRGFFRDCVCDDLDQQAWIDAVTAEGALP